MPPGSRAWEPARLVMLLGNVQNENCCGRVACHGR